MRDANNALYKMQVLTRKTGTVREKQCDQVNMLGYNKVQIPQVAHSFNLGAKHIIESLPRKARRV